MKAIRIFVRNIQNALKSITRNMSLSAASVICTTITLTIVSIAIILSATVNKYTTDLENSLSIIVYAEKDVSGKEMDTIETKIKAIKNVKKDEVLRKNKEQIKLEQLAKTDENSALYKVINSWTEKTNPLRPEFVVTVKDQKKASDTVDTLKSIDNVYDVVYREDIINKLLPVFDVIEKVTLAIIIGLILVTIILICNTIKLTIFARKNEIEIMRLVGTSNFVIKLPFVIEGLFLGVIGSIIPIVATIWGYILVFDAMKVNPIINTLEMIKPFPFTLMISLILLGLGCLVGMFGSYTTVRKYLKI